MGRANRQQVDVERRSAGSGELQWRLVAWAVLGRLLLPQSMPGWHLPTTGTTWLAFRGLHDVAIMSRNTECAGVGVCTHSTTYLINRLCGRVGRGKGGGCVFGCRPALSGNTMLCVGGSLFRYGLLCPSRGQRYRESRPA